MIWVSTTFNPEILPDSSLCLSILLWNVGIRSPKSPAYCFHGRCPHPSQHPLCPCQAEPCIHLRPRVDMEGAHFIAIPAHGLEGGVVIAQLSFLAQEVLLLKDGQPRVAVVLQVQGTEPEYQVLSRKPRSLCWPLHPCSCLQNQPSLKLSGRTVRQQAPETLQEVYCLSFQKFLFQKFTQRR